MNNDETLLAELLATDLRRNFRQLVLRYQDQLYSFAYRLTGSRPVSAILTEKYCVPYN